MISALCLITKFVVVLRRDGKNKIYMRNEITNLVLYLGRYKWYGMHLAPVEFNLGMCCARGRRIEKLESNNVYGPDQVYIPEDIGFGERKSYIH